MFRKLILCSTLLVASLAFAQTPLTIATGGEKGTYTAMYKELYQYCGDSLGTVEKPTSGSVQNLELLATNQVSGAIIQTDVLFSAKTTRDLSKIKTLLALHPEEVHVISKRGYGTSFRGYRGTEYKSITDLDGKKVGVWGGAAVTAQLIRLQGEINFRIDSYAGESEAFRALDKEEIDALIMVGGAPMKTVSSLKPDYTLLFFDPRTREKLKNVYVPATLNYTNLASGVPTVATHALLVVREYKTSEKISALQKFRSCATSKIPVIQDATGTHAKWQDVDPNERGKWDWYEFQTTQTTAPVTKNKR